MMSYERVNDVVRELRVMITKAPIPDKARGLLADAVWELNNPSIIKVNGQEMRDCLALHHDD
tara:strand:- start:1168 stop:1353 length:186 start_codon:yes stop_codon:yes gene_type:complete